MDSVYADKIVYLPRLRNCRHVFRDRNHAGRCLAEMIGTVEAVVVGIPAGGIPVAAIVAKALGFPLEAAVVSKITLPWNSEVGYGAVAFDGSVQLNRDLIAHLGLNETQVQTGIRRTKAKVSARNKRLRMNRPMPDFSNKSVILVDDGLASGFTMKVAVEALTRTAAGQVIVAVPTGHDAALGEIAGAVNAVYCPNVRAGGFFAVADAYCNWTDVEESEAEDILKSFGSTPVGENL